MSRLVWTISCLLLLPVAGYAAPAIDEQADAEAIIEKAIRAIGGRDELAGLKNCIEKTDVWWFEPNGTARALAKTSYCRLPGWWRVNWDLGTDTLTRRFVVDAEPGWSVRLGPANEAQEGMQDLLLRDDLVAWQLLFFKDRDHKLSTFGAGKVADRAAAGVKVSRKGDTDIKLYFDHDSGLLLKRETEIKPSGEDTPSPVVEEVMYENYKEFNGIKCPTKKTTFRNRKLFSVEEITEFKIMERIEEEGFPMPKERPILPRDEIPGRDNETLYWNAISRDATADRRARGPCRG